MFERIDHVGIAVADIDAGIAVYSRLCGSGPMHREVVPRDGIEAVMFAVGESRVELLAATRADSAISGFITRRGGGLHHVAYGVRDVQAVLDTLAAAGVRLIDSCPRAGAGGRLVAFVHPESAMGVLTEVCMPDGGVAGDGS